MLISKILHSKYSDSETKFQTKSIENKELTLETTKSRYLLINGHFNIWVYIKVLGVKMSCV